jgi:hypothetical protein
MFSEKWAKYISNKRNCRKIKMKQNIQKKIKTWKRMVFDKIGESPWNESFISVVVVVVV